jgi:hypothetical protein
MALLAGSHWAVELFCSTNWWTLVDVAENLLLCFVYVCIYNLHYPVPYYQYYFRHYSQLSYGSLYILQQNHLRLRNIIHVKRTWPVGFDLLPASQILMQPQAITTIAHCNHIRSYYLPRPQSLLALASLIWCLPLLNVLQTIDVPILNFPAIWLSPMFSFALLCYARYRLLHLIYLLHVSPIQSEWLLICFPPHHTVNPPWQLHALSSVSWSAINLFSLISPLSIQCLVFPIMWLLV